MDKIICQAILCRRAYTHYRARDTRYIASDSISIDIKSTTATVVNYNRNNTRSIDSCRAPSYRNSIGGLVEFISITHCSTYGPIGITPLNSDTNTCNTTSKCIPLTIEIINFAVGDGIEFIICRSCGT